MSGPVPQAPKSKKDKKVKKKKRAARAKKVQEEPKEEEQPDILTETPDLEPRYLCKKCGEMVKETRGAIRAKAMCLLRCRVCNTRAVQLSRFPGWTDFQKKLKDMPEDAQLAFWKKAGRVSENSHLKDFCNEERTLTETQGERLAAWSSGEYLPLSVYAQRGYDVQAIEAKCTDVIGCSIFGKLYRLPVVGRSSTNSFERVGSHTMRSLRTDEPRNQAASSGSAPLAIEAPPAPSPTPPAPILDAGAQERAALKEMKADLSVS